MGEPWAGVGKPWESVGNPWASVGNPWTSVGNAWANVGNAWAKWAMRGAKCSHATQRLVASVFSAINEKSSGDLSQSFLLAENQQDDLSSGGYIEIAGSFSPSFLRKKRLFMFTNNFKFLLTKPVNLNANDHATPWGTQRCRKNICTLSIQRKNK